MPLEMQQELRKSHMMVKDRPAQPE